MFWGSIECVISIIFSGYGQCVNITPFIIPTYSPYPKSVNNAIVFIFYFYFISLFLFYFNSNLLFVNIYKLNCFIGVLFILFFSSKKKVFKIVKKWSKIERFEKCH